MCPYFEGYLHMGGHNGEKKMHGCKHAAHYQEVKAD